jgi:hypothetical protein
MAKTMDVVLDSKEIQLEQGDDGAQIGKVTLANISDSPVGLQATIPGDPGCVITPNPASIEPGRRTEVTLTFGAACDVKQGADAILMFGADVTPSRYLLKVATAPAGANWDILVGAFVIGLMLSGVVVGATAERVQQYVPEDGSSKLTWSTKLESLGTDWSFKDNWVGNLTIGSTAVIALLASSDVLKAILGYEPESALGLLAVAAGIAAALVAIGPLIVKVIGDDLSKPTIGGTLVAAFVTLVGTIGQIAAVTWQGAELTSGGGRVGAIALGVAIGLVVLWYAADALLSYAKEGTKKPPQQPSETETMKAARVVATAIRESSAAPKKADRKPQLPDAVAAEPAPAVAAEPVLFAAFPPRGNSLL